MIINRTFDRDLVNGVVRHPEIYPYVTDANSPPAEEFDATQILLDNGNYALSVHEGDELMGVFLFTRITDTTYEVHTCLLPNCRGQKAAQAAQDVVHWMFARSFCNRIVTRCPDNNPRAKRFAQSAGLVVDYYLKDSFPSHDGVIGQSILSIDLNSWLRKPNKRLIDAGEKFRQSLERFTDEPRDQDEVHDTMIGLAVLLIQAGLNAKGMHIYNEWAVIAGFPQVAYLGAREDGAHIIDTTEMIVAMNNETEVIEVMTCRSPQQ